MCNAEPVVVNNGELYWANVCESWWVMMSRWMRIMISIARHGLQPLDQHNTPWYRITGSSYLTMIHIPWLSISHQDSHPEHNVLCWARCCEYWWAMLSQWLWIMVSYAEPVILNHFVLCWASGCASWSFMLSIWLLALHISTWFTTTTSSYLTIIQSHWPSIAYHDWQPQVLHSSPWFTTTCQWL
jgi:hypothetical protein